MIAYAAIMFVTSIIFGVMAMMTYKGKTELIHDYHQTKVADKAGYGKAFGKALAIIAVTLASSGVRALFWKDIIMAVVILVLGLITGICTIILVQRKYNGSVF